MCIVEHPKRLKTLRIIAFNFWRYFYQDPVDDDEEGQKNAMRHSLAEKFASPTSEMSKQAKRPMKNANLWRGVLSFHEHYELSRFDDSNRETFRVCYTTSTPFDATL